MNNDILEFWLPGDTNQLLRNADAWAAWTKTFGDTAHRLRQFDASIEEHGIELEVIVHRSNVDPSLIESCAHAINLLLTADPDSDGRRYMAQSLAQVHAKLRFDSTNQGVRFRLHSRPDLTVQPAGMLLFDQQASAEPRQAANWEDHVRQAIEQNPLARADAEFAIALDLPFEIDLIDRERLTRDSLQEIALLTTLLPGAQHRNPAVHELWLNLLAAPKDAERNARLRIWRLGVMQIAPTTRRA